MRCLLALAAASAGLCACRSPGALRAAPTAPAAASSFRVDGVATWRGDATAAYSLIHDDICDAHALGVFSAAEPELDRRGLHAGFGVVVGACAAQGRWPEVRALIAHGHDVFSHSWDHPCLTENAALAESCDPKAPRSVDFATEIGRAATALQAVTGRAPEFFIFPYDVCDPAAVAYLQRAGYLSARCGTPGVNEAAFGDPFAVRFDVFGPSYSRAFGSSACAATSAGAAPVQYVTPPAAYTSACRRDVLDGYVDEAIAAGGWAVRELHGLDPADPEGWETVALSDYRAHLDHVVEKIAAGALWVEGPTTVVKYRLAREACALPTVVAGDTLRFATPTAACRRVATVLSYRVSRAECRGGAAVTELRVRQGDRELPARRLAACSWAVDADPTRGDALLLASH
jgi:peptidoglycan/xylan/chitin deacetylase (PgdA/CDA1 family)